MTSGAAIERIVGAGPSADPTGRAARLPLAAVADLAALSDTLAGPLDDPRGPERVAAAIARCLGSEHASIMVHDAERDALVLLRPAFGIDDPDLLDQYRIDLGGDAHSARVFHSGEGRIVNGARADHVLLRRHAEFLGLDSVVSVPITVDDTTIGVLHAVNRPGGFDHDDIDLLDAIAPLVGMWVSSRRHVVERRRHDRRVAELVRLHADLTDLLADRLGADGLGELLRHHLHGRRRLAAGFRVALIEPSGDDLPTTPDGLRPRRRWVIEAVETIYGEGLVVPWRNQVVAVVPVPSPDGRGNDEDRRLAAAFIERIGARAAAMGLSAPADHGRLDEALSEAEHTLGVARRSTETTPSFEHLGLLRVLRPGDGGDDYAGEVLGPLLAHDATHSADLIATLRAWSAADYSITDAAAELDVHRNTVKYRLRQIRELLGFDPSTSPHRLRVELALQFDALASSSTLVTERNHAP